MSEQPPQAVDHQSTSTSTSPSSKQTDAGNSPQDTQNTPMQSQPAAASNASAGGEETSKPAEQPVTIPGLGIANGEQQVSHNDHSHGQTHDQQSQNSDFPASEDTHMKDAGYSSQTEATQATTTNIHTETAPDQPHKETDQPATKTEQATHDNIVASTTQEASHEPTAETTAPEPAPAPPAGEGQEEEEEHPEWEIDSSPYESSSSDSSSDDSDSEDEDYTMLDPEEAARMLMAAEGGSDDGGPAKTSKAAYVRTANEKPEEIVPIPDITVTPEMRVEMLGSVETIVDNVILIRGNTSGEYQVLESGSVLCLENLNVIGVVADTLGRVEQPLYTVRFTNEEAIKQHGIEVGKAVCYLYEHSTFVFTEPLKAIKGSDASNFHDEEVNDDEIEFSDDEAEAAYKRAQKQAKKNKKEAGGDKGRKPPRPAPGPSGLRATETLNYDDVPSQDQSQGQSQ
ncbi:hypothetical protein KEM56_001997, partial [Ascosphaera pollenicola]